MFNNNQNTTYNFGRDVINNNPVTVNNNPITNVVNNPVAIYLTEAEVCYSRYRLPRARSYVFNRRML